MQTPPLHPARPGKSHRSRGQALAEFALVVPVFALIFLATLDLGRLFYASITLTNAAREAAFQASQTPSSYQAGQPCPADAIVDTSNLVICRAILEAKSSFVEVSPAGVAMTCDPPGCVRAIGNTVSVTVSGQFVLLTPMLAPFVGGSQTFDLSSTATAQLESLPTAPTPVPTPTPTPTPSPTPTPTPAPSPTPTPTPSPTPACQNPPDIIDLTPAQAEAALDAAGFTNHQGYGDLTTGQKNKVQTQIPDDTQCVPTSTLLVYHYRPN